MSTTLATSENRIFLTNIRWNTYSEILRDLGDSNNQRIAYDNGTLEICMPSIEHEELNRALSALVEILATEWDRDARNLGSATFRREDIARGFEPDTSFYLGNAAAVAGQNEIDLTVSPPPDLVIEIDITSPSLDKMPLYARIGVPEVWRMTTQGVSLHTLEAGEYRVVAQSVLLSPLGSTEINRFVRERRILRPREWDRSVREWAQQAQESNQG